jgi:hypothetical protein
MMQRGLFAVVLALLVAGCSDSNEVCGDGEDNDSNGQVDCEDSACGVGAVCGPNGLACAADLTCSTCSGNGGTPEPDGETICGDGVDNDCDGAVDCADANCQPQGSQPGRSCDSTGRTCSVPDAAGLATCGVGSSGGGGGGGGTAAIGYLRLASAEHQVLGAFGSGYFEQSLLVFEVLASDGTPYAGLPVKFSHASQGGSFIGAVAACTSGDSPVCTAQGTTDGVGRVGVVLHSGRRYATLAVKAEATAAGVTRQLVAGGFTVVGAKPNGARFAVDCRPYNVPALTMHDCLYSRYDGQAKNVECTATLGDRHGNALAVPTLVAFQSEAGEIVPATFTPDYDPSKDGAGLGQALGVLNVYGAPLPFDVEPFAGEYSLQWDYGCGTRKANPRDGLVTVVALTAGEEGFVDRDLDGTYDPGEPFIDLGEPFVDVDDDGIRDSTEWYEDVNQDGAYTGPNGKWDADTVLWAQGRVLYTGHPAFAREAATSRDLLTRLYEPSYGSPPSPTLSVAPFTVTAGPPPSSEQYGVFFTDQHLNPLSSFTTFGAEAVIGNVTASLTGPSHTADSLNMSFRSLYCDKQTSPAVCRDGPADQGCQTSPCYLTTEIGRWFYYGNYATLSVTCSKAGPDQVQVFATVENVTSAFSISGECLP